MTDRGAERFYGLWIKNHGEGWHAEECLPDVSRLIELASERLKAPDVAEAVVRPAGQMPWT